MHLLNPGDALGVSARAAGHFTLARVPDAPVLWMIATGTGLAPYLSMVRTEEPWRRFGRIIVVHGVRHAVDQAYRDELAALSAAHDGRLTRVPVLSRERAPGLPEVKPTELATLRTLGAESAARMLFLAIEETVRLLGDAVFMGGRTPAMALVIRRSGTESA